MIILKNIEQIAEKYNCLVRDGATGLEDVSAFVETSLDLPKIKEYAAGLDLLDNKQNIIEDMSEMLFQLRDFLPSVGNFIKILLVSKNYEQIVIFVKKIFANQIGIIKYQSVKGSYSYSERYFDRFIEIVKNCKIDSELYLPFVAKIVSSNEGSVLYQWINPASEYIQLFFNQNEQWIYDYIRDGKEYKYELIEAVCSFNSNKGINLLVEDYIAKIAFDKEKSDGIFKTYKKDVINFIDKEFIFSDDKRKIELIGIYSKFLPDNEIITRLKQIYESDKCEEVKSMVASILGITDTLSIKTEKQFLYAVRRKIKEPQQRALGVVFSKFDLKLKSGYKCDDAIFTFIIYLFKEEKNLKNIKKLKVLENIFEMQGLSEFSEAVFGEIENKPDILCAKWAIRMCALLCREEKAERMANKMVELFGLGRRKEANYLAECLIYSEREQVLAGIKELCEKSPEILGDLKDEYANLYATANNKNLSDVYDELVEDVATDQSVSEQTKRLFNAFISKREYSPKKFEKLFMSKNVLGELARHLVWGEYNFGRLYNAFVLDGDEKRYVVQTLQLDNPQISIVHSLDLDERFDDVLYAIENPLFEQFRRSVFDIKTYSQMAVSVSRFAGMFVTTRPFIASMKNFGFVENRADDEQILSSMVYIQEELGTLVEVCFDKPVLLGQDYATLSSIYFYRLVDVTKNGNKYDTIKTNAISIGGVGERLFDFALNAVSVSSRKTN